LRRTLLGCAALAGLLAGCDGHDRTSAPTAPADAPWFEEEATARGLVFQHESGHAERYYMPEIMGGGAALFDADGDGDLDAYLVQSGSIVPDAPGAGPGASALFQNDGHGRFRDFTAESGAAGAGYGMGAACADVDEDGDTDLYVTRVGPNALLRNDGGRFTDVTAAAGTGDERWGTSAAFFDADRNGLLDLFVANYLLWSASSELSCMDGLSRPDYCSPKNYQAPAPAVFYANLGDGRFEDRSRASGVAARSGTGLGVAVLDFDADGRPDVFVANDGMPNHLWHNRGDGTFSEDAVALGCATDSNGLPKAGMGVAVADLDQDLDPDLLVCNLAGESDSYYENRGGCFADRTPSIGLGLVSKPFTRFGAGLLDFDLDGLLDLYEANGRVQRGTGSVGLDSYAEPDLVFRGLAGGGFAEVLPRGGVATPAIATSRAAAFGDVDGDGAIDVLVVHRDSTAALLMNRAPRAGRHWVLFSVREASGRDALGAELRIRAGGHSVAREVRAAYSYLASNDPRVHLGLGDATVVDEVRVRWADGAEERFGPLPADQMHVLARGKGRP
jgi:hypothetical protein